MKFKLPLGKVYKVANTLIGKKENEHYVQFLFPNAEVGGTIMNFIIKYVLQEDISMRAGSFSNEILRLYSALVKKINGGIPITGKLIISDTDVSFKPMIGQTLFIKGYEKVMIPIEDIQSVKKEGKWLGIAEYIEVKTLYGEFRCYVTPSYLGVETGDEICNQINGLIGR